MADGARWSAAYAETPHFTLKTYLSPQRAQQRPIVIYIEGDGFAWVRDNWVSPDPTPRDPFMLDVALRDDYFNAAYLARPCQYVIETGRGANCQSALWTDARFNEVVIADMSQAIDQLLSLRAHHGVVLVGGSGGGSVAMLVAARRNDIDAIVTLSGLLNHRAWSHYHKISSLGQSLNPADFYPKTASIPQLHLLAGEDTVIPVQLSQQELGHLMQLSPNSVNWREVPEIDHSCCWAGYWAKNSRQLIEGLIK
ncbi:alpha/beta hydrolase [Thalassospira lohafexi]|uniref:Alpha/beta hydrolase n=1 Tax=Thalassospira lohafexi TaxID=744227 RepID=A0A2N3L769_9PROT|nr:alpha/beta hydrolase [Thalassospira lohafexi]PKR58537.1 alpha/beta hydrolase [Thalassospira lohafexi]